MEPLEEGNRRWGDGGRTEVDLPEGAAPDLAAQLILAADDPIHGAAAAAASGS
jgi:hypothetical protein